MTGENQVILNDKDHELFLDIAKDIRTDHTRYREAGNWLNEYCSEDAYWHRQETKLNELQQKEKDYPVLVNIQQVEQIKDEINERRTPPILARFQEARDCLLEKYINQKFIPEEDARRIIIITWLLTDPDTENRNLDITELEKWPWEPIDDPIKMSRGYANFLWFHGGKVYGPWIKLVCIAWKKVTDRRQYDISPAETKTIVGETWTIAGIPVNVRTLKSKLCCFKGYRKIAAYVGILVFIILLAAFYTRSLWFPLIRTDTEQGEVDEESIIEAERLPLSLKEICNDIDNRPILQMEQTAKSYIGMPVKREYLSLFEIIPEEDSFHLLTVFPEESDSPFRGGSWGVSFNVQKNVYPELVGAKKGLSFYVSGKIQDAGRLYINLSDVSLSFD